MLVLSNLHHYGRLIRIERPIGSYLVLWPTLWALWIASEGLPDVKLLIIFVLGVFIMRSAGCAINDIADRNIDAHVERTRDRPIAAGNITLSEALAVFGVLLLLAFVLVLQLNLLTILFSVGAAALAASYPFMKRYHHLPQAYLGVAFSSAILMAFTAVTNQFPPPGAWLLFTANLLWTTGYDTLYGMCDREDDLKIGVKSTAILFGDYDRLWVSILQISTLVLLSIVGKLNALGIWFWLSLLLAAGLFAYQQYLIRDRDRLLSLKAFLNNNWVGMIIFIGIFLNYTTAR
ncbi:MAG: 4-hydroxybenzoate polyprenyltransferase (EC [uncultured Thiotrichaceae bacterium]|uniref:4-hydroxybenzoate octaprenyltransferase n=1 Tax=uncultured Thiotrichaceae bacterium TaxID=298394 RepID=A0A6S6TYY6_9GAMM|nr:MAG: 4-hydroxybenzoate polyprenyltransferase (EC [uncultured Thiotrichaceae bacterium]